MDISVKQVSSLEKIRRGDPAPDNEIFSRMALAGERVSYQIHLRSDTLLVLRAKVESTLLDCVRLYYVRDAQMDSPVGSDVPKEDYISLEPGLMPDILVPMEITDFQLMSDAKGHTLWVKVDVPKDAKPGVYRIKVTFDGDDISGNPTCSFSRTMVLEVLPAVMPEQKLIYSRWFYADCIAVAHKVEIFSEKHWELIDKYIAAAVDVGLNMLLVPIHTPPLDTAIGTTRPCVQLVDITKTGDKYSFSFEKFKRYIDICKKHGIRYFEMAHLFSQWGAKCAPNIMVTENGKTDYLFGWHVASDSSEYTNFLKQYIAAIYEELEAEGISQNTYFHISDEPSLSAMKQYRRSAEIIRPLIKNCKTLDAISNYEFYENGLVECPVTLISHIHEFLKHDIPNQWVYYCCSPVSVYPNSLLAMPSYRVRILGLLCYKYNIKGFLHWGFNYYNASCSRYPINPYFTTSGDSEYPSGDPFIVYPGEDCVYPSIRGEVTFEAIQDMNICCVLEAKIGRDAVVKMIDEAADGELNFDRYPRNKEYIEGLRASMIAAIKKAL